MDFWMKASYETLFYDQEAYTDYFCEISLGNGEIRVRYEEDDGSLCTYIGTEVSDGHFDLRCPGRSGKATLHRFRGSRIFEGFWQEDGNRGAWRITLHEVDRP